MVLIHTIFMAMKTHDFRTAQEAEKYGEFISKKTLGATFRLRGLKGSERLDIDKRIEITESLRNLAQEFDSNIYPKLRELFCEASAIRRMAAR